MATALETLPALLTKLSTSLTSAAQALPDTQDFEPPADGISLLDVKNELFLSYIQNLVFLILVKLRHGRDSRPAGQKQKKKNEGEGKRLEDEVTEQLVRLRVYLDKGVRPIENRLKFQIDKVVRAAEDVARASASASASAATSKKTSKSGKKTKAKTGEHEEDSAEDDEEDSSEEEEEEDEEELAKSYRPNTAAFMRPSASAARSDARPTAQGTPKSSAGASATQSEIYRPPRITPTTLDSAAPRRKPARSAVLDNYISTELSGAPAAEVSIGTDIAERGRGMKSAKQRRSEAERQEYEETNFVRLPGLSKKEKMKEKRAARDMFGGEDLRGLGKGLERIEALTRKRGRAGDSGGGGGKRRR